MDKTLFSAGGVLVRWRGNDLYGHVCDICFVSRLVAGGRYMNRVIDAAL